MYKQLQEAKLVTKVLLEKVGLKMMLEDCLKTHEAICDLSGNFAFNRCVLS